MTSSDARHTVEAFLTACRQEDFAAIPTFLAEDVVYHNVGMPLIHGRKAAVRFLRMLFGRPGTHFDVFVHRIAVDGDTVLTERTDASIVGPFRFQFWVCGVFEVTEGEITLWRDHFDVYDIVKASARAVIGALIPRFRPTLP